ncbi:MAG TPA: metal-sulfur cluster assembly factor [Dehalococcoidia bacterium]|nr:metal-sulfur cluster assembly factor [Dehalococcoidia bacterium]
MPTPDEVQDALCEVMDPELPISIVDLGLVRGVEVDGGMVHVRLTFTSLGCPCTDVIREDIRERLMRLPGVQHVEVEEVFEPWSVRDISPQGLVTLRQLGIT